MNADTQSPQGQPNVPFRRLKKCLILLRNAWSMVGIVLFILVAYEGGSEIVSRAKARMRHERPVVSNSAMNADEYRGETWVVECFQELEDRSATSPLVWIPYVYFRNAPFHGVYHIFDHSGLRATWNPARFDDSPPVRVFMFGGSTMMGIGARDSATIPSHLSRLLNRNRAAVEVTNFGQGGYVSTQEVLILFEELRRGNRPDIVIFYDGLNDIFSSIMNRHAGWPQNEINRVQEFCLLNDRRSADLYRAALSRFVEHRSLYRRVRYLRSKLGLDPPPDATPWVPEGERENLAAATVESYLSNVRFVEAMGREWGFVPIFFWQPTAYSKRNRTPFEEEEIRRLNYAEETQRFFARVSTLFSEHEQARRNSRVVNFADVLGDSPAGVYIDYGHMTESGYGLVASAMAPHVLRVMADMPRHRNPLLTP